MKDLSFSSSGGLLGIFGFGTEQLNTHYSTDTTDGSLTFSQRLSALFENSYLVNLTIKNDKHKKINLENLVDLPPDEEDDRKEVENDQGGDKDRRLRSIIPRTLPPPNLLNDYLVFN